MFGASSVGVGMLLQYWVDRVSITIKKLRYGQIDLTARATLLSKCWVTLLLYALLNGISVILGQCVGNIERHCIEVPFGVGLNLACSGT